MASYQRNTDRRYRAPVEGSLARKLDNLDRSGRMDFDELYERRPETAAERNRSIERERRGTLLEAHHLEESFSSK